MPVPDIASSETVRPGGTIAAFIVAIHVLGLVACGAETAPSDDLNGGAPGANVELVGALQTEAGQPIAGAQVMACMATTCFYEQSGADGRFRFTLEPHAELAIKTASDVSATPRRAAALLPVRLDTEPLIDVGPVHVPTLPSGAPIGGATTERRTVAAGDGLELTLTPADLTPALGDVLIDVAARRLPTDLVSPRLVPAGEELVAVYALHPFAAKSESPIAVRVPSSLPAGTAVRVRTVSEIDGRFSAPAAGRASGTHIETDPSDGITNLTYVVLTR